MSEPTSHISEADPDVILRFANYCQCVVLRIEQASHDAAAQLFDELASSIPDVRDPRARILVYGITARTLVGMRRTVNGNRPECIGSELVRLSIESEHAGATSSASRQPPPAAVDGRALHPKVRTAINFLQHSYRCTAMRLGAAAWHVDLSVSHLDRLLKRETGLTFLQHLKRLRMLEAERLLLVPTRSVKEVAFECGYTQVSTFTRDFRHAHGCTAGSWRAKTRT